MKIKVKVVPGAREQEVIQMSDGSLKIKLHSQPVKFKANKELIEVLADYYNVQKNKISIISGHTSSHKVVEIESGVK